MSLVEHSARAQFTVSVHCSKCGQTGSETWEENTELDGRGPQSQLIACSGEFHEREPGRASYSIELVCHRCGAVLVD